MKTKKKIFKRIVLIFGIVIVVLFGALLIYASDYLHAEDAMYDQIETLDTSDVTRHEDRDEITYTVANPENNIVFIPGGKVEPNSYEYLAVSLALTGNNVTISKAFLNLAIFTPNYAKKFLDKDLNNIIIGHSLGGVVASMLSSGNELVSEVIILGSYPIKDITDKEVLVMSAEFDIAMNMESFNDSFSKLPDDFELYSIDGGNHAQFGWYGLQHGDGTSTISTLEQQDIVISKILEFLG
jgi:pimeloyl-ACP methyl ester carboxylesterase